MATIRAKESDNIVYYLFEPGLVKLATYSQKVFWGVTLIVFLFFWIFIEIGGAIGGVIAAGIAAMIFNVAISSPKIDRWDKLSFADLKKEKDAKFIKWSEIESAVLNSDKLKLIMVDKAHKLKIMINHEEVERLLKRKLGNKLEIH
jgi:hypothetical protein